MLPIWFKRPCRILAGSKAGCDSAESCIDGTQGVKILHFLAPQRVFAMSIYLERVDLQEVFLLSPTAKRPYRGGLDRFLRLDADGMYLLLGQTRVPPAAQSSATDTVHLHC